MDGDGTNDIVASDAWSPDHAEGTDLTGAAVYLFLNKKAGFKKTDIVNNVRGPNQFRGKEISLLERNDIGDIDGDGLLDVAVMHLFQNRIMAFRNPGTQEIGKMWPATILSRPQWPVEIKLADIDGDGRIDMVTAQHSGGVWWAKNNGTLEGWNAELIARPKGWKQTRNILIADFDGDGRNDILATDLKAGEVGLFKKTSFGWTKEIIARGLVSPLHGSVVDFDDNGRNDLVIGDAVGIYVLLNMPNGWKLNLLTSIKMRGGYLWHDVLAEDMDADGDLDLVGTVFNDGLYWFENVWWGWRKHVLKRNWGKANQIRIGDLNGDGMPDIIASTEEEQNEVRYWLNKN